MAHYLLVDGYNIVFANEALAVVANDSLEEARKNLADKLCEYKALTHYRIILVFDAHLVAGGVGSVENYRNIKIVFTKEAETADNYIEKVAYKYGKKKDHITVATSDTLEQVIITGAGAGRISATDLWEDMDKKKAETQNKFRMTRPIKKNPIESLLDQATAQKLEAMRYGK